MQQIPLILTQEEIDEMLGVTPKASTYRNGYSNYGWYDSGEYAPPKLRTRHEWIPILLLSETVWNCKYCDAKKEKTKDDYCEVDDDTGGW